MLRRSIQRDLVVGLALFVGAASLCHATSIDDVRLSADCVGYTLFIEGSNFSEGEVLTVDYQFTLEYLGPDPAGEDVVVAGTYDLSCAPGELTCAPRASLYSTWTEALGAPLPCGDYRFVSGGGVGTCESIPSHWVWYDRNGQHCDLLRTAADWDGVLICPCDDAAEICRTPGFWATHAGADKRRSQNITQAVLDAAASGAMVCGQPIFETLVGTDNSALEAMCVSPSGEKRLQLARQLTAAALNCIMTSGDPSCVGVSILQDFERCDDVCAMGMVDQYSECDDVIDCFNNGGMMLENGFCQLGTCGGDGITPCDEDEACGFDDAGSEIACVPFADSCHEQPLVNESLGLDFDPPGPAGSSKACNRANKNDCTIFDCD